MNSLGDRRARVRLEVVGALRGMLGLPASVRLLNISRTGALIETPMAVPLESIQSVHFTVNGEDVAVEAHVRHVRHVEREGVPEYLVGVEFLSMPPALLHSIEQLAAESGPPKENKA
jgi:c-di-GMP-binding flagellar brake protein YcgR